MWWATLTLALRTLEPNETASPTSSRPSLTLRDERALDDLVDREVVELEVVPNDLFERT